MTDAEENLLNAQNKPIKLPTELVAAVAEATALREAAEKHQLPANASEADKAVYAQALALTREKERKAKEALQKATDDGAQDKHVGVTQAQTGVDMANRAVLAAQSAKLDAALKAANANVEKEKKVNAGLSPSAQQQKVQAVAKAEAAQQSVQRDLDSKKQEIVGKEAETKKKAEDAKIPITTAKVEAGKKAEMAKTTLQNIEMKNTSAHKAREALEKEKFDNEHAPMRAYIKNSGASPQEVEDYERGIHHAAGRKYAGGRAEESQENVRKAAHAAMSNNLNIPSGKVGGPGAQANNVFADFMKEVQEQTKPNTSGYDEVKRLKNSPHFITGSTHGVSDADFKKDYRPGLTHQEKHAAEHEKAHAIAEAVAHKMHPQSSNATKSADTHETKPAGGGDTHGHK